MSNDEFVSVWRPKVLGRVYSADGALHFVQEVDRRTGLCRIARTRHGRTEQSYLPLDEVLRLLSG